MKPIKHYLIEGYDDYSEEPQVQYTVIGRELAFKYFAREVDTMTWTCVIIEVVRED